jgi:hypothetical protein
MPMLVEKLICGGCKAESEVQYMTRPEGWSAVNVTSFWVDGKDAVVRRMMLCDKCTPKLIKRYPFERTD